MVQLIESGQDEKQLTFTDCTTLYKVLSSSCLLLKFDNTRQKVSKNKPGHCMGR